MSQPACAWNLSDLQQIPSNGVKVFSTFACGGGSSMGYKLAGCEVIGANDIDPEMRWHYETNLQPRLFIEAPVREMLTMDLPEELFNLDILDGSPPCSTFSTAGQREKNWGKEKHFREGQAKQILSDLFFDFLDVADRLKPRVIIAENVKGLIIGKAKGYTKQIMDRLREIGYNPQLFLVNAAQCGVPQARERVFFVAARSDLNLPPLDLQPDHDIIPAGEACADLDTGPAETVRPLDARLWHLTLPGESYANTMKRLGQPPRCYSHIRIDGRKPSPVITASGAALTHWNHPRPLNPAETVRLCGFPDDYQFKRPSLTTYVCGMSVPPRMMTAVASAVVNQWLVPRETQEPKP